MGYTVVEKWKCDWDRELTTDATLAEFVSQLEMVEPLNPHEALFRGRTNGAKLYHKVDETLGEQIKCVDVTSLYPWVHKYGFYPVGHPQIITKPDDQNIHSKVRCVRRGARLRWSRL